MPNCTRSFLAVRAPQSKQLDLLGPGQERAQRVAEFGGRLALQELHVVDQQEIDLAQRENTEGESFYVALLPQALAESVVAKLNEIPADGDRFVILGRNVYVLLRRSIRNSKLAIKLQKLLPEATLRNWNTITKLNELAI